jgi:hypothetical protein
LFKVSKFLTYSFPNNSFKEALRPASPPPPFKYLSKALASKVLFKLNFLSNLKTDSFKSVKTSLWNFLYTSGFFARIFFNVLIWPILPGLYIFLNISSGDVFNNVPSKDLFNSFWVFVKSLFVFSMFRCSPPILDILL